MSDKINLISSEMDGAELRREEGKNRYHARCHGRCDDGEINEAINHLGKTMFSVPAEAWERIFGGHI